MITGEEIRCWQDEANKRRLQRENTILQKRIGHLRSSLYAIYAEEATWKSIGFIRSHAKAAIWADDEEERIHEEDES